MYTAEMVREVKQLYRDGLTKVEIMRIHGMARRTLNRLLELDPDNMPQSPQKKFSKLDPHRELIYALFIEHGNCDAIRRIIAEKTGIELSLRRIQQFIQPARKQLKVERHKIALKEMARLKRQVARRKQADAQKRADAKRTAKSAARDTKAADA